MNSPSMHTIGLQLQHKGERIKELEREVARLKIGAQPASRVRDMVLKMLLSLEDDLATDHIGIAQKRLGLLIKAIGENIPGEVEYKPAPPEHRSDHLKPYVPLNHGPRDLEAAAAQYRMQSR